MADLSRTEMKHVEISPEALAQLGDGEIAYVKTPRTCMRCFRRYRKSNPA